ncbi:unnamed protein product [Phaedon cochleariae]|uniref:Testicular haploid expressed protein n=1 Tax=Phaedon cochleariae TaxID=80249 RepID=A0A9N9X3A1_PHACE|nr:unnamed protein product [Phaedon cochleariae]
MTKIDTECVTVDINVFPTPPPPPPPALNPIPEKILKILEKYKYNWRLDQLAKPRRKASKFIPIVVEPLKIVKVKPLKLDSELVYYADQQSRPPLRTLVLNKRLYGKQNGRKYRQRVRKLIDKSWGSIYNFYKKRERDKKLRQLRREAKKVKKTHDNSIMLKLATPKRVFFPEPEEKTPKKIFSDFDRLDTLAAPKPFIELPPKRMGVNPAALTYEPTEIVLKLAQQPDRYKFVCKPLEPGKVQRAALRYKITERTEALAVPKQRSEKAKVDEDWDPWVIPKNALKYKATTRILELAKPKERE